jgi:MYXO-CTERM domain-containing protein
VTPGIKGTASTTVVAGAAASYVLSGLPASVNAGTGTTFNITAKDASGNTATGYNGSAAITSSDPIVILPANPSFTSGVANGVAITFKTAGTRTVTATDTVSSTITGMASTTVVAGAAASYAISGLAASVTAGGATTFNITAKDAYGNTATSYNGTVAITSSDPIAILPVNPSFTSGVASGVSITFKTAGTRTVTATDTVNSSIKGTASTTVLSGAAANYVLSGLAASVNAGTGTTFNITAKDAFGNTATGYNGSAAITSSDAAAVLPGNPTFTNGVASGVTITFKTAGTRTVTATDTVTPNIEGTGSTTVIAGAAASYVLSGLAASVNAGTGTTFNITARDAFGNTATGYLGTAHFTSSDPLASLPPDVTFVAGVTAQLTATFGTAGDQTLTATDVAKGSVTGSAKTHVTPVAPSAAVTAPKDGVSVHGIVTLSVTGAAGAGTTLAKLEILVDGAVVASGAGSPQTFAWDSTKVADGRHVVTAAAEDASGQRALSAQVILTVANAAHARSGCGCSSGGVDGAAGLVLLVGLMSALRRRRQSGPISASNPAS